jgi:hypothetical protein
VAQKAEHDHQGKHEFAAVEVDVPVFFAFHEGMVFRGGRFANVLQPF